MSDCIYFLFLNSYASICICVCDITLISDVYTRSYGVIYRGFYIILHFCKEFKETKSATMNTFLFFLFSI